VLAAVFHRPLFRPVGADVHPVEHPGVAVIQRAAAQSHRVHLQPARALFIPRPANGNALAQQAARARAPAPPERDPQRGQQPVQGAPAHRQDRRPQIGIQPAMIRLVGGQPFGQQRGQARAAGLQRREPDRLEHGQELLRIVLARAAQEEGRPAQAQRSGPRAQDADGRLAMIAQQGHRLIEQLTFVPGPGFGVGTPQLGHHFLSGLLTHVVVHVG
jgi:hypothetical protein